MRSAWLGMFVGAVACSASPSAVSGEARPLAVRVIDAETSMPLAGVPVSYLVQTVIPAEGLMGALPLGGPIGTRVGGGEKAVTDDEGRVRFPGVWKARGDPERVAAQTLLVNVAVDMESEGAVNAAAAIGGYCREHREFCPDASAELSVAALMLSGALAGNEGVFKTGASGYGGAAYVWYSDPPGTGRVARFGEVQNIELAWLPAGPPGISDAGLIRLRRMGSRSSVRP